MKVRPIVSVFLAFAIGGCVWTADSVPVTPPAPPLPYQVHLISKRMLDGSETMTTVVSPMLSYYPYEYGYYNEYDSVRYIIVNGDTTFRHPIQAFPAVSDSSAPYRFDGTPNYVTFVYDRSTATDTSKITFGPASITWPVQGSTIQRDTFLTVNYREPTNDLSYNFLTIEVTDSITNFVSHFTGVSGSQDVGRIDIDESYMSAFKGNTLWVILHEQAESIYDRDYYADRYHLIVFDRMVEYSLQ